MSKTIVILMGKSGCGKSHTERHLIQKYPHIFHKVVSVTTRKMRPGETDGVDYYFHTDESFRNLDLVQQTMFAGNRYGSTLGEYVTDHKYAVLVAVPESAAEFIEALKERMPDARIVPVYFNIGENRIIKNMRKRGDTIEMIEARLRVDDLDVQFIQSGIKPAYVVEEWMLDDEVQPYDRLFRWLEETENEI